MTDVFEMILVDSERFGVFEARAIDVWRFPFGLDGFPHLRTFTFKVPVSPGERPDAFLWMVSLEDRTWSVPIIDPEILYGEKFVGSLRAADLEPLALAYGDEVEVRHFASPDCRTVNLQSPLVFNPRTRRGVQSTFCEVLAVRAELPDEYWRAGEEH